MTTTRGDGRVAVHCYVDERSKERLRVFCDTHGVTMSAVIAMAAEHCDLFEPHVDAARAHDAKNRRRA